MLLVSKNTYQSPELYYDITYDENFFIQYKVFKNQQLRYKVDKPFKSVDNYLFFDEVEDNYGIYNVYESFNYLTYSFFFTFFSQNHVDIPTFFTKTKSTKRKVNQILILKFTNYLMKSGLRAKTLNYLNSTIFNLIGGFLNLKNLINVTPSSWKNFYLIFNSFVLNSTYGNLNFSKNEITTFGNTQTNLYKDISTTNWDLKKILFKNLYQLSPIFSFYIYKVDKQIFKNTRGKSGKYTFIWKYVASYKRLFLVMFWLMKELRISPGRSLKNRLSHLLQLFILSPTKTWIFRVKKFSHNYVYRNCRNTLAETYRTVTK